MKICKKITFTQIPLIFSVLIMNSHATDSPENYYTNDVLDLDLTEILMADEIEELYSDTIVSGINLNTREKYVNEYYANSTVKSKRKNKTWRGIWYTDSKDRHCIRWYHKDTADCELIGQDEEGNWVKLKDEGIIKKIESFKHLPDKSDN